MKKILSVATLILFLIGTLSLVFCTRPVKAEPGTIYIRANGLVEGTDKIQRVGDLYTFIDNIYDSIVVERSNIVIDGNGYVLQGSGSGNGFELPGIRNVIIRSTNIERFNWGVYLGNSSGNSVSGNTFIDDGLLVYDSYQSSVENNTVNGRPLVYLEGVLGYTVDDAGQVILVKCDDVRVEGLNLSRTGVGIELLETRKCTISGNNITANNYDGIRLYSSPSNNVSGNNIAANSYDGIYLFSSGGNIISRNSIMANNNYGIRMFSSSGNNLSGNNIAANNNGGLFLSYASGNSIYHNNFIDNANPASLAGSVNVWDDGYPSGGNYWSYYSGGDSFNGPNQLVPGSDGIGDTAYTIDANNVDHYPLMGPFTTFDVGMWNGRQYDVDVISDSLLSDFSFYPYGNPPTLRFNATGNSGAGFCRVAIPKALMWCDNDDQWTVAVGGMLIDRSITTDANCTYIYFTYTHSTKMVQITSTYAVPEFQPFLILPLLIVTATLLAIGTRNRKRAH